MNCGTGESIQFPIRSELDSGRFQWERMERKPIRGMGMSRHFGFVCPVGVAWSFADRFLANVFGGLHDGIPDARVRVL